MKHVRLTMRAPEGTVHPVFDMLTRSKHVEQVQGLYWNFSDDKLGILHYVQGDFKTYISELESIPSVLDYDIVQADADHFYVYHRCVISGGAQELFESFTTDTLLMVPPIKFSDDGSATFSLFGDDAEVQAALDNMPEIIEVDVHKVSGIADAPGIAPVTLSVRQKEAVNTALSLGYYDIPRNGSYEDIAEAIDCAPSTAAEHLRKAERKLVRSALGGHSQ